MRNSKIYGGRICAECYKTVGMVIEAAKKGVYSARNPQVRFNETPQAQKVSAINRVRSVVRNLFRRRGVQ
jgi:hypothetical protein